MKSSAKFIIAASICALGVPASYAQSESTTQNPDSTEVKLPGYDFEDTTLDELVVTAKKKLVESDGATLTYNVEEDPDSKTSSVIEMLRKVPMVSVDADDNIRVKGEQNFRIFINGKEDPMLSGDPKTVLKAMPANSIKKIEVITEPGAKYDAEGTGGILNIITDKKSSLEGYLLNLNAGINRHGINGGLYGRTKIRKVTMSANGSFMNSAGLGQNMSANITQEYFGDNPRTLIRKTDHMKNSNAFYNGSFNLSWEADTLNLFTFSIYGGKFDGNQRFQEHDLMFGASPEEEIYHMNQRTKYNWESGWLGTEVSYQHNFKREDHHIVASYVFNYGDRHNGNDFNRYDVVNYPEAYYPWYMSRTTGQYDKHALQIDYSNKFNEHHTLEAGFKGTWYPDHSHNYSLVGENLSTMVPSEYEDNVRLRQLQNILAAYTSYTGTFGRFGYRLGLRYENTHYGLSYREDLYPGFTTDLNDLVPNAAVNWGFGQNTFRAAYQMRISRPSVGNLNPYRNTGNLGTVEYGNPDLDSERINSISLTWSNYGGPIGGQIQASYSKTNNCINRYSFVEDGLINMTYLNLGHKEGINFSGNAQWRITNMMNFGLSGDATWNRWKCNDARLSINSCKWSGNFNANWDYSLPKNFRASAYGGWGSFAEMQSAKPTSWYYYGINFSRSMLKEKRLTLSVGLQTFLPAKRTIKQITESDSFRSSTIAKMDQWNATFSVSYRLGALYKDVKKTAAELDKASGGSQSGGIGM